MSNTFCGNSLVIHETGTCLKLNHHNQVKLVQNPWYTRYPKIQFPLFVGYKLRHFCIKLGFPFWWCECKTSRWWFVKRKLVDEKKWLLSSTSVRHISHVDNIHKQKYSYSKSRLMLSRFKLSAVHPVITFQRFHDHNKKCRLLWSIY